MYKCSCKYVCVFKPCTCSLYKFKLRCHIANIAYKIIIHNINKQVYMYVCIYKHYINNMYTNTHTHTHTHTHIHTH